MNYNKHTHFIMGFEPTYRIMESQEEYKNAIYNYTVYLNMII